MREAEKKSRVVLVPMLCLVLSIMLFFPVPRFYGEPSARAAPLCLHNWNCNASDYIGSRNGREPEREKKWFSGTGREDGGKCWGNCEGKPGRHYDIFQLTSPSYSRPWTKPWTRPSLNRSSRQDESVKSQFLSNREYEKHSPILPTH